MYGCQIPDDKIIQERYGVSLGQIIFHESNMQKMPSFFIFYKRADVLLPV